MLQQPRRAHHLFFRQTKYVCVVNGVCQRIGPHRGSGLLNLQSDINLIVTAHAALLWKHTMVSVKTHGL